MPASRTTQAQARSQASISPPASTQAGRQASRIGFRRQPLGIAGDVQRRPEQADQDRLVDQIDRQAVAAGEGERRASAPPRPPFRDRRRQPRQPETEQEHAAPGHERTPIQRRGVLRSEAQPHQPRRIERGASENSSGGATRRRRRAPAPATGAASTANGAASRLATNRQCRMPNPIGVCRRDQIARRRSPAPPRRRCAASRLKKGAARNRGRARQRQRQPASARNAEPMTCEATRIGGVNGVCGATTPK